MNLGVLNTIIAVVIVLLVLSLIVQAIQGLLKKLFKLKSKQIVGSLEDLYEQALADTPAPTLPVSCRASSFKLGKTVVVGWLKAFQAFVGKLLRRKGAGVPAVRTPAQQFTDQIVGEFTSIGRSTRWGNPVLDSLSKDDLLKIMAKLDSEGFLPDYVTKFQTMVDELNALKAAIEALSNNAILTGSASAKLAEIRMVLAPLFYDVQAILEGDKVKPNVLLGDLLRLGNLKLTRVPELLNDAQQAITQEIEVANQSNLTDRVKALNELSVELAKIAVLIGNLSQKFDNAVAPLRIKLTQVGNWYDTVMQSFDERYARSMKTWAVIISIVVVILLNANFFNVYRSLSKDQFQSNLIVQSGQKVLDAANKATATPTPAPANSTAASKPTPAQTPVATPAPTADTAPPVQIADGSTATPNPSSAPSATPLATTPSTVASNASANRKTETTASPSPAAQPSPTPVNIKKEAEEMKQNIDLYVNMYENFGFSPLSAEQARDWLWSTGVWTGIWAPQHSSTARNATPGASPEAASAGSAPALRAATPAPSPSPSPSYSTGFWGFTITRNEKGVPLTAPLAIYTRDEKGNILRPAISLRKPIAADCSEIDYEGNSITYDGYALDNGGTAVSCSPDWRPMTFWEWWASRKHDASVIFGWAIMVLLLSVGAPFWQDALESLFGVKNLLRQKSGTQNIEKESGAGQPKQS